MAGSALLTTPAGVPAHLSFGFVHAYRCGYTLWGSAGRLGVDRAYSAPGDHRPRLRLERSGQVQQRHLPADDQFAKLLVAFAGAIRDTTATARVAEARQIVRQARLVEAIAATARRCATEGTPE